VLRHVRSVRGRTTLAAILVVGIALAAGVVVLLVVVRRSLVANIDGGLRIRAGVVAAAASRGEALNVLPGSNGDSSFVQITDTSGTVLAASPNIEGEPPLLAADAFGPDGRIRTVPGAPIGQGRPFRALGDSVSTPSGTVHILVGATLASVDHSVAVVGGGLSVGAPILLLVVAVTTWMVAGRALSPVEAIRAEVAEISMQALDRRVPEPATTDEVGRLARTMNAMLDRLGASAARQRQFVSDASHELRSPLAGMRAELEVALAHQADTQWPRVAADVLEDLGRVQRLVEQMLVLARLDEGAPVAGTKTVDLDDLVLREARRVREHHNLAVDVRAVSAGRVRGDPDRLRQVVRNLVDKAARHARTVVRIGLQADASWVQLTVADDGPGIPPSAQERIFERFTRLDQARATKDGGYGLGLAISREIVVAHGGTIEVDGAVFGARLVVRLPVDQALSGGGGTKEGPPVASAWP
jgi:signal transduction histidine kinase